MREITQQLATAQYLCAHLIFRVSTNHKKAILIDAKKRN